MEGKVKELSWNLYLFLLILNKTSEIFFLKIYVKESFFKKDVRCKSLIVHNIKINL